MEYKDFNRPERALSAKELKDIVDDLSDVEPFEDSGMWPPTTPAAIVRVI